MKDVTTIILSEEHRRKIEELIWETRAESMSDLVRNLIDNEYVRIKAGDEDTIEKLKEKIVNLQRKVLGLNKYDMDIIKTGLKVIGNMLQGRLEGNISTASDGKILESVEDLIEYMEG